ncbi:cellulose biosynthesis protein BcsR [Enterobacillus tribolii]|uniref:Cellulose biosynthesis protein BcsR n=1 Tax=Enterobacillus tribolii TaxID=1487935 RepID=A0A370QUF0_9GAMM|nr:cellulose biosynthesis protein BcsR [Enterobacillus tribolii]MBW7981131.1 hypothetical protein [Enterobacillus tribolii]RDK92811.1 cellulose biosynthesis protein BcsR [Enterobacillus tribolii]
MNDKRNNPAESDPSFSFQNDIDALRKAFSLPKIDYVDISRQEHLTQVIARWPLLAELAQAGGSKA